MIYETIVGRNTICLSSKKDYSTKKKETKVTIFIDKFSYNTKNNCLIYCWSVSMWWNLTFNKNEKVEHYISKKKKTYKP